MSIHRVGVNEGFLTKHTLKLTGLNADNAETISAGIDALVGVDGVWIDVDKSTLQVAYDASHLDIEALLGLVRQHGADVSQDWWNQFKLSWDRQIDQNIKNNAKHEPHCCNKMPFNRKDK